MLKGKSLPNDFWAKVIATFFYFLNRCPIRSVKSMTPFQVWSGRKPSVSHLKFFGRIMYAHVLGEKRKKLEDKSVK